MNPNLQLEDYAEAYASYIDKAKEILMMQEERNVVTLTFQDEAFPQSFRKIRHDCPPLIHCLGNLSLLNPTNDNIAIIGARAASPAGNRKAYE